MNDDTTVDPTLRAVAARYFDRVESRPLPRSLTLAAPSFVRARPGFRAVRALAAVAMFVGISAALTIVILVTRNLASTAPAHTQAPQASSVPTYPPSSCGARIEPTPTNGIAEYPVRGLDNIGPAVTGPDGNVWFVGGALSGENGDREVVGRVTPAGKITLYSIPGNPGEGFDGIAAGPGGYVWFSVGTGDTIGRLTPGTGHMELFPVHVPTASPSATPVHTQTIDMVSGPGGDIWFDVESRSEAPGPEATVRSGASLRPASSRSLLFQGPGDRWAFKWVPTATCIAGSLLRSERRRAARSPGTHRARRWCESHRPGRSQSSARTAHCSMATRLDRMAAGGG